MPSRPRRRLHVLPLEDRTVPAVVDFTAGTLTFTAGAGEANDLRASVEGGRFHFEQAGSVTATVTGRAGTAGWMVDSTGKVSGPVAGVRNVDLLLGDGDDHIAFNGFVASLVRLTVDGGSGQNGLAVGDAYALGGDPYVTVPNPQQTGVGAAGDVTFKNFAFGSVYKYIAAGGAVRFTNAGTVTPMQLLINRSIVGSSVGVVGGTGDDTLRVDYRGPTGAEIVLPRGLSFDGGGGSNTLVVAGETQASHTFTADGSRITRDGASALTMTRVQTARLTGGPQADAFTVTPSATTAVEVLGAAADDTLTVQAGTAVVGLTATQSGDDFSGTATVTGMRPIKFDGIESIAPRPAALIDVASASSGAAAGRTVTITVTVANASAAAALNGVAIADVVPAQFQNVTWTATGSAGSTLTRSSGSGAVATTANIAAGGRVTITVTAQVRADSEGQTATYKATATTPATSTAGASAFSSELPVAIRRAVRPSTRPTEVYALGAGPGSEPRVVVFNRQGGAPRFNFLAFDASFRGGVNVTTADVTGDGVEDVIAAPASMGGPHVKVFDGASGALVRQFMAYDASFRGGVNLAAGYITGDARADIIAAPASMGGPHVKVFDGQTGAVAMQFLAFDAAYVGGVNVAAGDFSMPVFIGAISLLPGQVPPPQFSSPDGVDDIVVAAGAGGGPQVKVFDGQSGQMTRDFLAYAASFRGGVHVTTGDVDGDGRADIVTAPGTGGAPQVKVFSGAYDQYENRWQGEIKSFLAFDAAGRAGYRVTTLDLNMDGKADILTATGPGVSGRVAANDGVTTQSRFVFGPFDPSLMGGITIG